MSRIIKILILEDNKSDAEFIRYELKKSGLNFETHIVETKEAYEIAIEKFNPDIVLSDYSLPSFDGVSAYQFKQTKSPDTPFIIVSGTIGEENSVALIKSGITDYVLKSKLFTLVPKITRALKERDEKVEKRIALEKLIASEALIRNFSIHLNNTLEEERAHIAREIHDDIGQQLAVIKIEISFLKEQSNAPEKLEAKINNAMLSLDDTIQSLRKIATKLRPSILDSFGLIPSIEWLVIEFEQKTKINCKIIIDVYRDKFDKNVSTGVFRICQESLTNILKHANATKIVISIHHSEDNLSIKIADNGKGFDSEKLENPFSMGILGMRERASMIGADLQIQSKKNSGTTVELNVNVG